MSEVPLYGYCRVLGGGEGLMSEVPYRLIGRAMANVLLRRVHPTPGPHTHLRKYSSANGRKTSGLMNCQAK